MQQKKLSLKGSCLLRNWLEI